jgi:hypothetical protein
MTISAAEPVATLARIRARSDGQPVLWWWHGEVLGKRPGEIARRLMRINGVGFNRLRLRYLIEAGGLIRPSFPGAPFDGQVAAPLVVGDRVWSSERLAAQFPAPATPAVPGAPKGLAGEPMEVTHFCAALADVENPLLPVVPATMSHTTMWSFYPWMGMDADAGYVLSEIIGMKIAGPDYIPAALRERIERDHPGFLANPDI